MSNRRLVLLALALGWLASCSLPLIDTVNDVLDANLVGVVQLVGRSGGSGLAPDEELVLEFLQPLDERSLALGASLGNVAGVSTNGADGITSARVSPPEGGWPAGSGQVLTVDGRVGGRAIETTSLSFDIITEALHVSAARGRYSGSGSAEQPLNTIRVALARAAEIFGTDTPVEVRLAQGVYLIDETEPGRNDGIDVPANVTISGGYSQDFSTRDPSAYPTVIRSVVSVGPDSWWLSDHIAITLDSSTLQGVTVETRMDGRNVPVMMLGSSTLRDVVIDDGSGTAVRVRDGGLSLIQSSTLRAASNEGVINMEDAGLFVIDTTISAAPTGGDVVGIYTYHAPIELQNSSVTVEFGQGRAIWTTLSEANFFDSTLTAAGGQFAWGVYATACDVLFVRSEVSLGPATFNTGIDLAVTDALIVNSVVDAGLAENWSRGVAAEGGTLTIRTSTIGVSNSGLGSAVQVTAVDSVPVPTVIQNVILTAFGGSGAGHLLDTDSASTTTLQNSTLDGPVTSSYLAFRAFESGARLPQDTRTVAEVETAIAGAGGTADTNNDADPAFASEARLIAGGDWRLTASTPLAVREGGLDGLTLGWNVEFDADGVTRTVPWSIGAYEYE